MAGIVILHFAPVELYPPVRNLTRYLEQLLKGERLTVVTTKSTYKNINPFESKHPNVDIKRFGLSGPGAGKLRRILGYLSFNLQSLILLIRQRPQKLMYYETISAFPAYF